MAQQSFKALVVQEEEGRYVSTIQQRQLSDLPVGDLLVKVHYSSLNYKDALSASGNKGVTRNYPHTPGIDAAGTVISSENSDFLEGDKVIVTSYDLGMNTVGGFGEYIRVPASWALPLPEGMTLKQAMILGTAGLTAGMSIARVVEAVKPEQGAIAVSGATGGVGSLSVAILAKLGYEVAGISGKEKEHQFLLSLGAKEVIARSEFEDEQKRPLLKERFAAVIDTVGGRILENLIKSTQHMGVVTLCGNVAAAEFQTNVYPFILRGLSLVGIESQNFPMAQRRDIWQKLATEWQLADLSCTEVTLDSLDKQINLMLKGGSKGRILVTHESNLASN